ncbi:MAG: DegT/DnrJ/EryC1/StrS family aminotransferase [Butyrivibrio sp.]|nr:DegT/DnrJ/EryC1/StrS family aminotransferase [Butyrivibrio sp.]
MKIPVYKPSLIGKEKEYVMDCIDTEWISWKGKYVPRFEKEFSKYIGMQYGLGVFNGTVALHLAMLTLGIAEGDEVIVPSFTYVASVNAITYVGGTPVFVDSKRDTWQMDPEDVRKKITDKTKAIVVVHLYGHPCEMDELTKICKEHDLFMIEDCAEAIGSEYKGRKVGSFGDIACFSFFGNKTITTGEGGMVLTNDIALYERAARIKDQGNAKYRMYWSDIIGYNFRMTNIQAAIGCAQLENIDKFIDRKIEIAAKYREGLKGLPLKTMDPVGDVKHTYWMCSILLDDADERDNLRAFLEQNGVESRPTFYPVHTMPMYSHKYQKHANAEYLAYRGINLPSFPAITDEEIDYVIGVIKKFFNER